MSFNAQLVLLTGSNAGLVAAIHPGYYLVGRSSHCQIRPKTRSVSRQHCLLYFGDGSPQPIEAPEINEEIEVKDTADTSRRIHVMDLGSASGTRIDGKKVSVRKWRQVPSGGELRCGKIAWRAVVNAHPQPITPSLEPKWGNRPTSEQDATATDDSVASVEETPSPIRIAEPASDGSDDCVVEMVKGQPWQGEDVAAFLANHDDIDRKHRREKILAAVQQKEASSSEFGLAHEKPIDAVEDDDFDTQAPSSPSPNPPRNDSPAASNADGGQYKSVATKKGKRASAIPYPTWDTVKLALALALTIAVIGFGIYRILLFRSGPPVRVYQGIGWKSSKATPLWVRCGTIGPSETHMPTRLGDKASSHEQPTTKAT